MKGNLILIHYNISLRFDCAKIKSIYIYIYIYIYIQGVPGGNVNILGGYSIGHSKQKTLYEYVSYFERFPR